LLAGLLTPLNKDLPIDQNTTADCRPVNAQDADTSLWCKSICKKYSTYVGKKLEPEQLAVGTPSGIHNKMITIRIQQERARLNQNDNDPQKKIIASTLDFVNAHNLFGN
jgi:hypothetical protein